jgi:outer membrane protein TolC
MKTTRTTLPIGLLALLPVLLLGQGKDAPAPLALSLREAVRMALSPQGNIAIGVAGESVRAAQAQLRESRSTSHPDIDMSITGENQLLNLATFGLQSVKIPIPGFTFPQSSGAFSIIDARVHVKQDLIDVASTRRSEAARAGIETATTEIDEVRDQVAAQVAKLYLVALRARSAVETAQALVASAETSLREVTNRNKEGKALDIDVSHARMRLATEKQGLMDAQLERGRAYLDLLSAMNRDLDTPLELTEPLDFTVQETLPPAQAVAAAFRSRSEIVAQRQRVAAARLKDVSIEAERLPSLAGYADLGSLGTTFANSIGTYDVGVSLRIPVFDGDRRNSRRAETQANIRQEELRASQLEKQVELEVRQALLKLDIARGQVDTAAQEVEVAQQELAHRQRRYEQGVEGQMELEDAQVNMARAADGRVAALCAWNEARIELMQAMGTIRTLAQ